MTRNKEIFHSSKQHTILFDDYKKGFRNWKENTTISPSGRRLGHHHSLLTPDGVQYSKQKEDFSEGIWRLHHNITSIALLTARPLRLWLTSIVILIPNDKGKLKIHRLRIINTYESEYNLILKYFWLKVGIEKAEKNKWLGYNQMGGRHNMSSIEPACINELIIEVHRLTRTPLCIHQDDAKGYYDRIIRNHANLNKKNSISQTMLEIYIVKHMKRWHSEPNYITPSPQHPTPAQKSFNSMERGKELETQEQNGLLSVSPW